MLKVRVWTIGILAVLFSVLMLLNGGFVRADDDEKDAVAVLHDKYGNEIGTVSFTQNSEGVTLTVSTYGLTPGFHGMHIHSVGLCDPNTATPFSSAGGHFVMGTEILHHGSHQGDLPTLLVDDIGRAKASFFTDRFMVQDLFDANGSAVIVHGGPDNFANIPTDRYEPNPDATTLSTGDAGGRAAYGVIMYGDDD